MPYPLCPRVHQEKGKYIFMDVHHFIASQNLVFLRSTHISSKAVAVEKDDHTASGIVLDSTYFIPSLVYSNDKKPADNLTHCYAKLITVRELCTVNTTHIM
jgi:hypothetical protein